jgi:hypothetical protein
MGESGTTSRGEEGEKEGKLKSSVKSLYLFVLFHASSLFSSAFFATYSGLSYSL